MKVTILSDTHVPHHREDWLDAVADTTRVRADEPMVGGGHTHEVEETVHIGIKVLNPGSATGVGPADGTITMMTAEVADGDVSVAIHEA